jgi:class 3 adenylate cyclase
LLAVLAGLYYYGLKIYGMKVREMKHAAARAEELKEKSEAILMEESNRLQREHSKEMEEMKVKYTHKLVKANTLLMKLKKISQTMDANSIVTEALNLLKNELAVMRGSFYLVDPSGRELYLVASHGYFEKDKEQRLPLDKTGLVTLALGRKEPMSIEDAMAIPNLDLSHEKNKYMFAVPLVHEDKTLGAITIAAADIPYEREEVVLLTTLGVVTSMALFNANSFMKTKDELDNERKYSESQLREKKHLTNLFSKFVDRSVLDEMLAKPEAGKVGGTKMQITVMFTDIRSFTKLSEGLDPAVLVGLLNDYFNAMTNKLFVHQGTLDKYIGDSIMALYGAPIEHEDDARRAVETALEMQSTMDELNKRWNRTGEARITMGVGINTGVATVGLIGSDKSVQYTAMGDTVNVSSRVCGVAKPGQILIAESTYEEVGGFFKCVKLEPVLVKGKSQPLPIWEVIGKA